MKNSEDHYHKHKYSMYSKYKYISITSTSDLDVFFVFALKQKPFHVRRKNPKHRNQISTNTCRDHTW